MRIERLEPRLLLSVTGDMNNDGLVNHADAVIISEYVVHLRTATVEDIVRGDLSGNGNLSAYDSHIAATESRYDGHTTTIDGILNVWAPTPSDFGATWCIDTANPDLALWGVNLAPDYAAIRQGYTADCYILADIAGIAYAHPAELLAMVKWDGVGVAVTFTRDTGAKVIIHVSPDLSKAAQVQTDETYWEFIEKAFCYFRTWNSTGVITNTLASIGWGNSVIEFNHLGEVGTATYLPTKNENQILATLSDALAMPRPVTFSTTPMAPSMIVSHVYTVLAVDTVERTVTVFNPWGWVETRTIADLLLNGNAYSFVLGS